MKISKYCPWLVLLPFVLLLQGCDYAIFNPKGQVGEEIKFYLYATVFAMLIVVIPTLIMIVYFPYKYRHRKDGNYENVEYKPDWAHSSKIEFFAWGVPIAIIAVLATFTYIATHKLEPQKWLTDEKPKTIEVVAMNWKWLFIYPDEQIATVNELYMPVDQPVEFRITSDGTMNSFFIPRLGSQLYAMSGMENKLNLVANEVGVYQGISSNYSGFGFAGMEFKTHAVTDADFASWVQKVRNQGSPINEQIYAELSKESRNNPVAYYGSVSPGLFDYVMRKYESKIDKSNPHAEHSEGSGEVAETDNTSTNQVGESK